MVGIKDFCSFLRGGKGLVVGEGGVEGVAHEAAHGTGVQEWVELLSFHLQREVEDVVHVLPLGDRDAPNGLRSRDDAFIFWCCLRLMLTSELLCKGLAHGGDLALDVAGHPFEAPRE